MNTDTNSRFQHRAIAALAAAVLIAPLAGCAGVGSRSDTSVEQRSLTDVAERRLALRETSRTDVAERRLALRETSRTDVAERRLWMGAAASAAGAAPVGASVTPDVVERRQWMAESADEPIDLPDVVERRLWMGRLARG
ncbi:hypothetical protein GCM10009819_08030 [Agromyces tropicus]|uniref:Uncharacterized protein n=1 Tax=Agromyces tropicus TaxID=555371 RepID=A0ABN2U3H0_9MICO